VLRVHCSTAALCLQSVDFLQQLDVDLEQQVYPLLLTRLGAGRLRCIGRSCSACAGVLSSSGCLWERRCCHWVAGWRRQLFGRLLLALVVLMLSLLLLLLLLLLLEVMLGPRIW
jgi:hypothetical protein